jgi:hypothetical protein
MVLMPHNASADADTRGRMALLLLNNLKEIIKSSQIKDLSNINLIPEHKKLLEEKKWKIHDYWKKKLDN